MLLKGVNSIILDRDFLATVQLNLQLTDTINCSPTDRSVQTERTFHGAVEAKTNQLFSSIHRPATLTTAHPNPRPFASDKDPSSVSYTGTCYEPTRFNFAPILSSSYGRRSSIRFDPFIAITFPRICFSPCVPCA